MQSLLLTVEQALKSVVSSSLSISLPTVPIYTGLDNEFNFDMTFIVCEAEEAEEMVIDSGVHNIKCSIATSEPAPEGDPESTTFADTVFSIFEVSNLKTILENADNNLFVYSAQKPKYTKDVDGDLWVQSMSFNLICCHTAH